MVAIDEKVISMTQIDNLIKMLLRYNDFYERGIPLISDEEYDKLYFQLKKLEEQTGYIRVDSPTQTIPFETVSELTKQKLDHPMLSLDKTTSIQEAVQKMGTSDYFISLKLDGLSMSLRYEGGNLVSATTRGTGAEGENVLHNARQIQNIPNHIAYKNTLIIDGEVLTTKENLEKFPDYTNARSFAAGSLRLLDSEVSGSRGLSFYAWRVIEGLDESQNIPSECMTEKLNALRDTYGFSIVPYIKDSHWYAGTISAWADATSVTSNSETKVERDIAKLKEYADEQGLPIDGMVFAYDNIVEASKAGTTGHHPKHSIALKFADESFATALTGISYEVSRTGRLTPVAEFETIQIDGTDVNRASLHNLTVMEEVLGSPYIGQTINVVKAKMIIPMVVSAEKKDNPENVIELPKVCPICGAELTIEETEQCEHLYCPNEKCPQKLTNVLNHYCSRNAMDIKKLSKATLEKLMSWGWVKSISDIYELEKYKTNWIAKPGFGAKSVQNILDAIEASKKCDLASFITALGIPLIGRKIAEELASHYDTYEDFRNAKDIHMIHGFGVEMCNAIYKFDYTEADMIMEKYLECGNPLATSMVNEELSQVSTAHDKTFCVTGKLVKFKRSEIESYIKTLGGKVTGSVSKKTDYLICNDKESTTKKTQSAKELGIPILTEEEFLSMF
jgi:DNA ligase (NAD+)